MEQDKTEHASALVTILVIDDEELVRRFLSEILTMQGYRVLVAQDGMAAIGIYKRQFKEIDLVLTDLVMPGLQGAEVLDLMRTLNPALKAVIMSGYYGSADLMEECFANVVGLLRKPFTMEQMGGLLKKALHCAPLPPFLLAGGAEMDEEEGVLAEGLY